MVNIKEKLRLRIVAGMVQRDERKRTTDEVSKQKGWHPNWVSYLVPGSAQREPAYCLCGARYKGGMNLN